MGQIIVFNLLVQIISSPAILSTVKMLNLQNLAVLNGLG